MLVTLEGSKSLVDYCKSYTDFCGFVVKLKEVSVDLSNKLGEDVEILVKFDGLLGGVCKAELIFGSHAKDLVLGDYLKSNFDLLKKVVEFFDTAASDRFCLVPLKYYKPLYRFYAGSFMLKIFISSVRINHSLVSTTDSGKDASLPIVGYKDCALVVDGDYLFVEEPALADIAMYWLTKEVR